ncbi:MAG TPA: class I adenylate-forming enzyme family protein [Arenibaculum sp.]|nr:class I adenylate-forming enzyme family protein [Arenibaculum sp.]
MRNTANLSARPLLDAFEAFGGTVYDLNRRTSLSGAGLRAGRDALGRTLAGIGVGPGDRVLTAVSNGPLFPIAVTALLGLGACPLLIHADTPLPEMERTAGQWGAHWVLTDATASIPTPTPRGAVTWDAGAAGTLIAAVIGTGGPAGPRPGPLHGPHGVPLHPTSGTSGRPKVALRPGPSATAEADHYIETLGIGARDTVLCMTPMSHAYAYGMCFAVPLRSSATVVTMRQFNPRLARRAVEELGITVMPAVPAMLDLLLRERGTWTAAPLQLTAGAPLDRRTAEGWWRRFGVPVRSLYGTTETGGIAIAPHGGHESDTLGPPMSGVAVRVRGLPGVGQPGAGLLEVSSSSMMAGYLDPRTGAHDPVEGPVEGGPEDGWFRTGDLAEVGADGHIRLLGRESDLINVMGHKVIPSEVAEMIGRLDGVMDVIVYAGVHRSGGQIVQAAVVARREVNEDLLRRHCEASLVSYKLPSRIHFLEELPRNPAGKVIRTALPDAVGAHAPPIEGDPSPGIPMR